MSDIKVKKGLFEICSEENEGREISCEGIVLQKVNEVISKLFRKYYSINEAIKVEGKTEEEKELNRFLSLYICVLYRYFEIASARVEKILKESLKKEEKEGKEEKINFNGKNFFKV